MAYDSTIAFTLDTICPWTYLALRRLLAALTKFRTSSESSSRVNFTIHFRPYQLYPEASQEGESKYDWYKKSRYGDSEEKMKMYTTLMSAYGASVGIEFKFGGTVANTLQAHRLIWWVQDELGMGEDVTLKLVQCRSHLQ
jgi:predicted DsbA family dithiol-disulfide isomerase